MSQREIHLHQTTSSKFDAVRQPGPPISSQPRRADDNRLERVGTGAGYTRSLTRRLDGKTDIDLVIVREGRNLEGRFRGFALTTNGKDVLERAFENSVKAIETRCAAAGRLAA